MKRIISFLLLLPLFANSQTPVSNNFQFNTPKAPDSRTHALTTVPPITSIPYASVAAANAAIPLDRRYEGLTVCVGAANNCTEHWYHGGTANGNLIMKMVAPDWGLVATPLPVNKGGTGTTTPSLVAGTNVNITGTWPNQTISATGGGGGGNTDSLFARQPIIYNIIDYGAKGDGKFYKTATMVSGSPILTVSSGSFTLADVGKPILVNGMGVGGIDVLSTIIGYTNASTVTLAASASTAINSTINPGDRLVYYGTDNTAAIQSAIAAAWARGSGVIYIPRGIFMVAGGLVTSDNIGNNPNSQLFIPSHIPSYSPGGTEKRSRIIVFRGETPAAFSESGFLDIGADEFVDGSIIQSLLPRSAISGELPALLGTRGPTNFLGSFNPIETYIENLWFRTHHDHDSGAILSGVLLRYSGNTVFTKTRADLDVSGFNTVRPRSKTVGIMGVQSNGGTVTEYNTCLSVGYFIGQSIGEHCVSNNSQAFMCWIGLDFQEAGHASSINRFLSHWCPYPLSGRQIENNYGTGLHYIAPSSSIVIERMPSGHWYNHIADVNDPSNIISGQMAYSIGESGAGLPENFTKIGGNRLIVNHMKYGSGAFSRIYEDVAHRPTTASPGLIGFNQEDYTLEVKQVNGTWQKAYSGERVFREQFGNANFGYSNPGKKIGIGGLNDGGYVPFRITDPVTSGIEIWRDPSGGNTDGRFGFDVTGGTPSLRVLNVNSGLTLAKFIATGGLLIGNSNTPTSSMALDVQSTTGFFYPPRMSAAQAAALTPDAGAVFFVTTTSGTFTAIGLWYFTGSVWTQL